MWILSRRSMRRLKYLRTGFAIIPAVSEILRAAYSSLKFAPLLMNQSTWLLLLRSQGTEMKRRQRFHSLGAFVSLTKYIP